MTTPATPTREVISFGPFSLGRMPGRTKHAGFLHFGDTAVAPQRGHRQKRSDEPGLAGHYRAGRQPLLSHREPSEGAWRRKERRPLHQEGIGARLPLCGVDFCGANNAREDELQKLPAPSRALLHHCRVQRRTTTLAVAIEHRLTAEFLSSNY